jgi:1-acyl-sn-glycerol-3-phosphate acyltransferase
MTQTVQATKHDNLKPLIKEETIQVVEKKKGFADMLPKLLENNLFDQAVTQLRKWTDILNVTDAMDNIVYWYTRNALRNGFKLLFNWKAYQSSNFPEFGPVLLVSNHQCVLDPFIVGSAMPREISWMSQIENFQMPIFKSILSFFGTFSVKRDENPSVVIDKAIEILNKGNCVGMFPAGTRSEDAEMDPKWKTGAARIILKAKVPYVPAAVLGSHYVLPKNKVNMKIHPIEVRVGEPVWHEETWNRAWDETDVDRIRNEMYKKVHDLMYGKVDPKRKIVITADMPEAIKMAEADRLDLSIT